MTIEFSLRRRAKHARLLAALWLLLAVVVLCAAYISFPSVAGRTIRITETIHNSVTGVSPPKTEASPISTALAVTALVLTSSPILFACFLMGRCALAETQLSMRFNGLADALCIAGDNFERLERAAAIMAPRTEGMSADDLLSSKELKTLADVVKQFK